jgi:hypothetical protein
MNHLVDSSLVNRIQVNLAESRQIRTGHGALWFNILMFLTVIGGALTFLAVQYHHSKLVVQPMVIQKRELIWNNSIRNSIEL